MYVVSARNVSLAWLEATERLLVHGRDLAQLFVEIENPLEENTEIRRLVDTFVAVREAFRIPAVQTVANTIFPQALYLPRLGDQARQQLYDTHAEGRDIRRRHSGNRRGQYFDRLTAWEGPNGTEINQLERMILRLRGELKRQNPLRTPYELEVGTVEVGPTAEDDGDGEYLRIYRPDRDNRTRGFPCLTQILPVLHEGRLHMTATYRSQHFISRAYGNYLGLGRLLEFICHAVGCEPGPLVCIANLASAEIGTRGIGKRALSDLVSACRAAGETAKVRKVA